MSNFPERDLYLEYLRGLGLRVTAERMALLEEIFTQHGHVDADRLLAAMRRKGLKISRATVYRNLDLMVESGLVRKYRLGRNRYLFEHLHPGQQHDHLVCVACGRVAEFISPHLRQAQAEICVAQDFEPVHATVKISGLCLICSRSAARRREAGARGTARIAAVALTAAIVLLGAATEGRASETDAVEPASSEAAGDEPRSSQIYEHLLVTGGPERAQEVPGSAHYIGRQELRQQEHSDIHRILERVPGVNLQSEEGFGLRPNIGMRGTGVERSQKITLLEDGILIAPAPYAAPAAYYFPAAGRMESVEVRKGSSSIQQGPYTTGGILNLVTSSIPGSLGGRFNLAAGADDTVRLHANFGDSTDRFGWMLETYQLQTDGFKELDGGGPTGVELEDYLGKLRLSSAGGARVFQSLELKLGTTGQVGDETYLGLTQEDFDRTPLRRYAGSQEDLIDTDHDQFQLRYLVQPSGRVLLSATGYRNDFFRNWHKLQSVDGAALASVLDDPARFADELALLRGERDDVDGALSIRNNRRRYRSQGGEVLGSLDAESGAARHRLEFGVRVHEDEEDRFQEEDSWNMLDGRMHLAAVGVPGSQANRIDSAAATALFVRNELMLGSWRISPGLRFESIDFERRDFGRQDPLRDGEVAVHRNGVDVWIPGIGLGYQLSDAWSLFGGVHKGFAPPGPGKPTEVDAEESVNLELGFNYRDSRIGTRVVAFFNDYDNLLGRDTLASGGDGTGDAFNGGAVEVRGLEASLDLDAGRLSGWLWSVPVRVSYTYTAAEFLTSFETGFADWSPQVTAGDELPYLPPHRLFVSAGVQGPKWSGFAEVNVTDRMRTRAGQGPIAAGEGTDRQVVLDATVDYRLRSRLKLFAQMRNVTDAIDVVARRPAGLRPGLPRSVLLGISWDY